ncbi:hypothetical protein ACHAXA_006894 [Cyclostephanos tholiformis]|uniref:Uncharacterized protein n=1 Tax=Cyclostephanos tholiformis TaxID=382380 RepID=A0ABD3SDG6_9STRA
MGAKSHEVSVVHGVDGELTSRALKALLKHHESPSSSASTDDAGNDGRRKEQLLGNDIDVQVQFSLVRVPGNAGPKPIRIDIPHPLVNVVSSSNSSSRGNDDYDASLRDVDACIIVKDVSKPWVQEMITRFPSQLGCIKKVLTLSSLRIKHKTYEQRRLLLDRYDVFFADDRILPMLTKALGTKFFNKKKQPLPVKLSRHEALPYAIRKCLSSTYMYLSSGTCLTVKVGNTSMMSGKLLDNISSVCSLVPNKVPRKWNNIKSICIKTTNSLALPIYNKTPEELAQIARLARVSGGEKGPSKEETLMDERKVEGGEEMMRKKKEGNAINDTPLARALKKQKRDVGDEGDVMGGSSEKRRGAGKTGQMGGGTTAALVVGSTTASTETVAAIKTAIRTKTADASTSKSSKKIKGGGGTTTTNGREDESRANNTTAVVLLSRTKKSSKNTTTVGTADDDAKGDGIGKEELTRSSKMKRGDEDAEAENAPRPKSAKKVKRSEGTMTGDGSSSSKSESKDGEYFVASKKFAGPKGGYVFKKGDSGIGYYRDVLPVVDKVGLASLLNKAAGSARKSMGGQHINKRKKAGDSRRSY